MNLENHAVSALHGMAGSLVSERLTEERQQSLDETVL